jgi:hypothetical protein
VSRRALLVVAPVALFSAAACSRNHVIDPPGGECCACEAPPDARPRMDAARPPDTGPPPIDAAAVDCGLPDDGGVPPDVDVVGRYHDCGQTLELRADGTLLRTHHREACTVRGRWRVSGRLLSSIPETTDCGGPLDPPSTREVTRVAAGIVLVDRTSGGVSRLADDSMPHATWLIEGTVGSPARMGSTTARIVGRPGEPFGSGCYWSTDGACGGLFSCSGSIGLWEIDGAAFTGRTECGGGCPCGAVLVGAADASGAITARFQAANCAGTFLGDLVATPLGP